MTWLTLNWPLLAVAAVVIGLPVWAFYRGARDAKRTFPRAVGDAGLQGRAERPALTLHAGRRQRGDGDHRPAA